MKRKEDSFSSVSRNYQSASVVAGLLAVLLFGVNATKADVVTYQDGVAGYSGTQDTFVMESEPDATHGTLSDTCPGTAVGPCNNFEWDADDPSSSGQQNIGLLRFDDFVGAGGGQIPQGATILSATLTLTAYDPSVAPPADIHLSLVDWDETTATWNNFGGDAGVQPDELGADVGDGPIANGAFVIDITTTVQSWVNNPASNFGLVFVPNQANGVVVRSSEYATTPSERPLLTIDYQADPTAPAQPTLVYPLDGASDVEAAPTLEVTVTDPQADPMDVTFFGRSSDVEAGADFTIIQLPDLQNMTTSYPQIWEAMADWIVANKDTLNIRYVASVGDLVNTASVEQQWINADIGFSKLEDPLTTFLPEGIPYGTSVSNHDQSPNGSPDGDSTLLYNQYFGISRFLGREYYGGHYPAESNDNSFTLFSASGMDFIVINLEYDTSPDIGPLNWADNLLQTYSDRRAIVVAHYIMEIGLDASFGTQGQAIYDSLKDNPNLFLLLCGHRHGEGLRTDVFDGRTINTVLSDYQDLPSGGNGWLRILEFSPANDTITVTGYSPWLDEYGTDTVMAANSTVAPFNLTYDMTAVAPFVEIGTDTGVASSGNATAAWPGRAAGSSYEWYVDVSDGVSTTTGPTWTFTSDGACVNNTDCDDALFCNGIETCGAGNVCVPGTDPCPGQLCDDVTDACVDCQDDFDCTDGDSCNGVETCNTGTGLCEAGAPIDCSGLDDACNVGACNALSGQCEAQPTNEGGGCNDGLSCTINDICASGVCAGADDCPLGRVCNPQTDTCTVPPALVTFQEGLNGYAGTVDTYLREQSPSTNHGGLDFIEWDADEGGTGLETIGLLRFDDIFGSGFGKIPVGSTVVSATLTLQVRDSGASADLREVLVDWDEAAEYGYFGGDSGAQSDEYGATTIALVPASTGTQQVDVSSSIQAWALNPASNRGWILLPTGSAGAEAWSSEAATSGNRPELEVVILAACETNADCDDGNPCTIDTCNGGSQCDYTFNTDPCDDGDLCTQTDTCSSGACVGSNPISCPPAESCDPLTGICGIYVEADPLPIYAGDPWRYFKGTEEPPAAWNTLAFDDSAWLEGPTGIGYGDGDDATTLTDMQNAYVSVYARRLFHVEDVDQVNFMTLTIDYDDAYVAYINGVEVSRSPNIAGAPPAYDTLATPDHEASGGSPPQPPDVVDLVDYIQILHDNNNVLALQGHNATIGSSDFSLIPELEAEFSFVDCLVPGDCDDADLCTIDDCVSGACQYAPVTCPPGETCNPANGQCELPAALAAGDVIVSGFQASGTDEWIELFNTTTSSIALDNLELIVRVDANGDGTATIDWQFPSGQLNGETIPAHGFYLFREGAGPPAGDFTGALDLATGEGGTRAISLELLIDSTHMDYALYGFNMAEPGGTADVPPGDLAFDGVTFPRVEVIRSCAPLSGGQCTASPPNFSEGAVLRLTDTALYAGHDVEGYYTDETALGSGFPDGVWSSDHTTPAVTDPRNSSSPTVDPPIPACTDDLDCDDLNPCTDDSCNTGTGECVFTPNTLPCDDSNPCTDDVCSAGACVGTPNDSNACTDGIACTDDACSGGVCVATDNCTLPATCNPGTGLCESGPVQVTFQNDGTYSGTQDAFIMAQNPDTVYGTLGDTCAGNASHSNTPCDNFEWDGQDGTAGQQNSGMIRFDDIVGTGAGQIPPGSTILSATLTLTLFDPSVDPPATLHPSLVDWDQTTVTYNNFGGDAGVQGDEYGPSAGTAPITVGTHVITLTASVVQGWVDDPASNYGLIILPSTATDGAIVWSSEYATVSERPLLTVEYQGGVGCTGDPDCDFLDGPCTDGQCVATVCEAVAINEGGSCADADVCNGDETCVSGVCTAGTPLVCDDLNSCTVDSCDAVAGCQYANEPDTTPCPDADLCNGDETCVGGVCTDGPDLDCDDLVDCTDDSCDAVSGCLNVNNCTSPEVCNLGTNACEVPPAAPPLPIVQGDEWRYFKGTVEPTPGADLRAWTEVTFDDSSWLSGPSGIGYDYYAETGGTNGNGDYEPFIGTQLTDMRICTPVAPPLCNDPGYVSLYMRKAFSVPNPGAVTSLTLEWYADDGCVIYLNGVEVARSTNMAAAGTPPTFDQLSGGLTGTPTPTPPVDITLDITGSIGLLVPGINVLSVQGHNASTSSRDLLMIPQLSSTESGVCTVDGDCDDLNPCTDDTCPAGTCVFTPNDANACDDGESCTDDVCTAGTCVSTPDDGNVCTDGVACTDDVCSGGTCSSTDNCTGGQTCNLGTGFCESLPTVVSFQDDGIYIGTQDAFVMGSEPDLTHGTLADTCPGAASPGPCDNFEWDAEDPAPNQNIALIRFDDIVGSGGDQIPQGATILSATMTLTVYDTSADPPADIHVSLVDWDEATVTWNNFGGEAGVQADEYGPDIGDAPVTVGTHDVDVMTAVQGWVDNPASNFGLVVMPNSLNGAVVRASEYAVVAERPLLTVEYQGGVGCTGDPDCDFLDGPCTDGQCIATVCTAVAINEGGSCADADVCNGDETCQSGVCTAGTALNCDDLEPCTIDTCDAIAGCQYANAPNGTPCPDSDLCNGDETCQGGVCTDGFDLVCDDLVDCTNDSCDAASGCLYVDNCPLGFSCDFVPPGACVEDTGPDVGDVIISGFNAHPEPEWIELFNTTDQPIALDAMTIMTRLDIGAGDGTVEVEWTLGTSPVGMTIAAHSFFLVGGGATSPAPDFDVGTAMDLATGEGGSAERAISIELVIDGVHMDYVLYGRHDGSTPAGEIPPGDIAFDGVSWPRTEVVRAVTGTLPIASFVEGPTQRLSAEDLYAGYDAEGFYTDEAALPDSFPVGVWTSAHSAADSGTPRNSATPPVPPPGCLDDGDCIDALFCNGVESCDLGTGECVAGADPCPGQNCSEDFGVCTDALMSCDLLAATAPANGSVSLDLLVQDVIDVRGFQTKIAITRTSGTGTVSVGCPGGVQIDTGRGDYVFGSVSSFETTSCTNLEATAVMTAGTGGVTVGATPAYLSDYLLTVSGDAAVGSTFEISIVAADSYLLDPTPGDPQPIPYALAAPCVLTIDDICFDNNDCIDANPCTDDECITGSCVYTDNTDPCDDGLACTENDVCAGGTCGGAAVDCSVSGDQCNTASCDPSGVDGNCAILTPVVDGTPCDDGQYCTQTDDCSGGVCVGSGDPCAAGDICNETTDTCDSPDPSVLIELVALSIQSPSDYAAVLPASETEFLEGGTVYVEVWAQTDDSDGLQSVSLDVSFDESVVSAVSIEHALAFFFFTTGTINPGAGFIDDLSGSHEFTTPPCADQVGFAPNWARVAIIEMQAGLGGTTTIASSDPGSPVFGNAICNTLGDIPPQDINFGSTVITVGECFADIDCADDGFFCNGAEVCNLTTNQCESTGDPCLAGPECADTCDDVADTCNLPAGAGCGDPADDQCLNPDICDGLGACEPNDEADGFACDDGDPLTINDQCNAGVCGGTSVECISDAQCPDDGLFCNGSESCNLSTNVCESSGDPCLGGGECTDTCDEGNDNCNNPAGVPCGDSADDQCLNPDTCDGLGACQANDEIDGTSCDDGQLCTENDACNGGICAGTPFVPASCDDSNECTDEGCDAAGNGGAGACVYTNNTGPCEDGLFCSASDHCSGGVCIAGGETCPDSCEYCDEVGATCNWCIFDLVEPHNGIMDGFDFAVFSACFGACYPPGDPCEPSNFDGDPAGCVAGNDFGAFSGCFGLECVDCPNCSGPGRTGDRGESMAPSAHAILKVVAVPDPSPFDSVDILPRSLVGFAVGRQFHLEVWASVSDLGRSGLASVYVDLDYGDAPLAVSDVVPSSLFTNFTDGVDDPESGVVRTVGGCAALGSGAVGVNSEWVRVATIPVIGEALGVVSISLSPTSPPYGLSLFSSFENIPVSQIDYQGATIKFYREIKPFREQTHRSGVRVDER